MTGMDPTLTPLAALLIPRLAGPLHAVVTSLTAAGHLDNIGGPPDAEDALYDQDNAPEALANAAGTSTSMLIEPDADTGAVLAAARQHNVTVAGIDRRAAVLTCASDAPWVITRIDVRHDWSTGPDVATATATALLAIDSHLAAGTPLPALELPTPAPRTLDELIAVTAGTYASADPVITYLALGLGVHEMTRAILTAGTYGSALPSDPLIDTLAALIADRTNPHGDDLTGSDAYSRILGVLAAMHTGQFALDTARHLARNPPTITGTRRSAPAAGRTQ